MAHRDYLKRQRRGRRTLALRLIGAMLAFVTLMLYVISRRWRPHLSPPRTSASGWASPSASPTRVACP